MGHFVQLLHRANCVDRTSVRGHDAVVDPALR